MATKVGSARRCLEQAISDGVPDALGGWQYHDERVETTVIGRSQIRIQQLRCQNEIVGAVEHPDTSATGPPGRGHRLGIDPVIGEHHLAVGGVVGREHARCPAGARCAGDHAAQQAFDVVDEIAPARRIWGGSTVRSTIVLSTPIATRAAVEDQVALRIEVPGRGRRTRAGPWSG